MSRRHAVYVLGLLERFDWSAYKPDLRRNSIIGVVEDVRIALDWAYATGTDHDLAMRLAIAAERAWLELSLIAECEMRMAQVVDRLDATPGTGEEIRARALVGLASMRSYAYAEEIEPPLFIEALLRAEANGDAFLTLRALYTLVHHLQGSCRRPELSAQYVRRFQAVAATMGDPGCLTSAIALTAFLDFELGEFAPAYEAFLSYLAREPVSREHAIYLGYGGRVAAKVGLALLNYYQGLPETGLALAEEAAAEAAAMQHSASQFFALGYGVCLIACFSGNLAAARDRLPALEEVATHYQPWSRTAQAFRGMLARQEGDLEQTRTLLESALNPDRPFRAGALYPALLIELADVQRELRDFDRADSLVDLALEYKASPTDVRVVSPVLRARAEILLARGGDARQAEDLFSEAMELARAQGAWTFEMTAALGLGRLHISQGRPDQVIAIVAPLLDKINEGRHLSLFRDAQDLLSSANSAGTAVPS